jgi:hypothetical protein
LAAVCSQVRNARDAGKGIVGLRPSKFAGAKALSCFGLYGTTKQLAEKHLVGHCSSVRGIVKRRHARR